MWVEAAYLLREEEKTAEAREVLREEEKTAEAREVLRFAAKAAAVFSVPKKGKEERSLPAAEDFHQHWCTSPTFRRLRST